jgi:membrane-bound metal-dependent hydrolase YbcI (DUF457 family)
MFFFFHLLIGFILGLFLGELLQDRRWVLPAAIGAVIPDLIDKPLGYVVFSAVINNGRIFFHSLLLLAVVFCVGILVCMRMHAPWGLSAAFGMLSHHMLDVMWLQPTTWFYPFLGSFLRAPNSRNIFTLLMNELTNPFEWILLSVVVFLFFIYHRWDQKMVDEENYHRTVRIALAIGLSAIVILLIAFLLLY